VSAISPLSIVHVIPDLRKGGAERLVLDMAHEHLANGHQVNIITFRDRDEYPGLSAKINVQAIPSEVVYRLGGKDVINTAEFDARIRELNPDIIQSHLTEAEFISRHNPLKSAVYTSHWHGCYTLTNPRPFSEYLTKDAYWKMNAISQLKRRYLECNNQYLCISEFIKEYVDRALSPPPKNLHVIPNGCDLSNFKYEEVAKSATDFNLVSVGSFHWYKNHLFLLKVMKRLNEKGFKDIKLTFLGDGAMRDKLEAFTAKNNLQNCVTIKGYVDNTTDFLNTANVLVHSAIDEPFGLVLLEAMSCKLPIVAFRSGGIPEIVQHERTGFLTDVNDVEAFASYILELKGSKHLEQHMGSRGREVVQQFSIQNYVQQVEDLYHRLIERKKRN
jgi:L-malate glycosyltransferase